MCGNAKYTFDDYAVVNESFQTFFDKMCPLSNFLV